MIRKGEITKDTWKDKLQELENDQELSAAILEAKSADEVRALLAAKGIDVTEEELKTWISGETAEGELTEDALEDVAGGRTASRLVAGYRDGYRGNAPRRKKSVSYALGYAVGSFVRAF